jgi:osmotically-inducible protein OsmY
MHLYPCNALALSASRDRHFALPRNNCDPRKEEDDMNRNPLPRSGLLLACAAALLISLPASAGGDKDKGHSSEWSEKAGNTVSNIRQHATLEAKLAENSELSALMINTDVKDGVAYMEGEVENETQRALAEEIAMSVDGVESVQNDLEITGGETSLAQRMKTGATDSAITAAVKSRLLVSSNTSGLDIKVDTKDEVVTLTGEVDSEEERDLAELIAANTTGVEDVKNEIDVNNRQGSY